MASNTDNPFKFGSELAKGIYFVDREEDQEKLKKELKRGGRVVVYSDRRYGKTTLIVNVLDEMKKDGYLIAYLDVSTTPDKSLFISKYKSLFIKEKSAKWFIGWLKTNIPKIKISVGDVSIDASGLSQVELDQAFEKIVDLPQELAIEEKKRVIVALDEFHAINDLGPKVKNLLRSKLQHQDKVSYVFSGSEAHILQDMFAREDEPFYKSAIMFELHKIPREAYGKFIKRAFNSSGIQIDDSLIDFILESTYSNTYYTQELCHGLWDYCKVRKLTSIKKEELTKSIEQLISDQSAVYVKIWETLAPTYRKLLIGLVSETNPQVWSREFMTRMRLTAGAVDGAIRELTKRYLIEKRADGKIIIPDPFFKSWLIRKIGEPGY